MPRFTIRDVLWLTVVAALGLGWWIDRTRVASRPPPQPVASYELIATGKDNDKLYLLDRRTGDVWEKFDGIWHSAAKFRGR